MYKKDYHPDENLIYETEHYKFPVSKSTTEDPDLNRTVKIDEALYNEAKVRLNEDTKLNKRVNDETKNRENADESLESEIYKITPSIKFLRFGKDDFTMLSGSPVNVEVFITMLKINYIIIMFHRVVFTGNAQSNFISYTAQLDLKKVIQSDYKVINFSIWQSLIHKDDNILATRSNDIQIINNNKYLYYQTQEPTGCVFCGTTICMLSK
jgi:hypothetical protein